MKFEIKQSKNGKFYWRLVGKNGEKICHSQQYTTKQSALRTVARIKAEAAKAGLIK